MHLKSMIYSDILNTDILTFFEERVMPSLSLLMMLFLLQDRVLLCCKGSLLATCSICCPPGPQILFFPAGGPLGCAGGWGFSSPDLEVCISYCWIWDFCWPISLACQSCSDGQHSHLVYQLLCFVPSAVLVLHVQDFL